MVDEDRSSAVSDTWVGQRIGRYAILRLIGRGGMGEVYLAEDTQLSRLVAVKALPADHVPSPRLRTRFEDEIRNTLRVSHPYIAQMLDVVERDDRLFLVMEYVRGRPLSSVIKDGVSRRDIRRWGQQIAEALAAIHGAGLVHRDLKPGNVMITESGHVKVLDFGIAKRVVVAADGTETQTTVAELTQEGTIVGTRLYMSPEQARGQADIDSRSDLFSLGLVLYEALTGVHPFQRGTGADTTAALLVESPNRGVEPPTLRRAGRLREIVHRLLRKERAERYQLAEEVARALEAADERPNPLRSLFDLLEPHRRAIGAVVAVALTVAAGAGAWWVLRDRGKEVATLNAGQAQLLARAQSLRSEGRYREALALVEDELRDEPRLLEFELERARLLMESGQERRAREALGRAEAEAARRRLDPRSREALAVRQVRAVVLGDARERLAALEQTASLYPETPNVLIELAAAQRTSGAAGSGERALATLNRHLASHPLDPDALLLRGAILGDGGDFTGAARSLDEAAAAADRLKIPFGAAKIARARAKLAIERGDHDTALQQYEESARLYRDAGLDVLAVGASAAAANIRLLANDVSGALRLLEGTERLASDGGDLSLLNLTLNSRAVALYRAARFPEAEPLLRRVIDQSAMLEDAEMGRMARGNLAGLLQEEVRMDEAARWATELRDLAREADEPSDEIAGEVVLAHVAAYGGREAEAIGAIERLLERENAAARDDDGAATERRETALANVAYLSAALADLRLTAGRPAEARPPADSAVELNGSQGDLDLLGMALATRARVLIALDERAAARRDVDQALQMAVGGNANVGQLAELAAGELEAAEGRAADAARRLAALAAAAGRSERHGLRLLALLAEAEARRRAGDKAAADRLERQVLDDPRASRTQRTRAARGFVQETTDHPGDRKGR